MKIGKLVVIEGIYGSGKYIVDLVERLRETLTSQGREVYEIDSPDSGRAQLMGAQDLDCGWRYGLFKPDFFYEMASRARACSVIRDELRAGKIVLCKNFTLSSIAYARMKGHDWFREDLNGLEARARGLGFGGEVAPDLTLYVDLDPEAAVEILDERIEGLFTPEDIELQARCFKEELAWLPKHKLGILDPRQSPALMAADALALIGKLL